MSELIQFKTLEEHNAYYYERMAQNKPWTKEEIDRLSPDNIDNAAFWREIWEKFGPSIYTPANNHPNSTLESCWLNASLIASSLNAFHFFEMRRLAWYGGSNVLEIGPGLGNLWVYLRSFPYQVFNYLSHDIFYPAESAVPYNRRETNLDNLFGNSFDLVYSMNVFQHLTQTQWNYYFDLAHRLLMDNGHFNFSCYSQGKINAEDGKAYTYHFGQLTEAPSWPEITKLISSKKFEILSMSSRQDGFQSFFLRKISNESTQNQDKIQS
jgi:2-polyprenyl-3-methyl-5-hydroxy-6-metoxy-1,4-benzoquinol methylase